MNNKTLGTLTILLSPTLALASLASKSNGQWDTKTSAFLGLAFLVGWICAALGLRRARATGYGRVAQGVFALQLVLLTLAACQQVMDLLPGPHNPTFYQIADLSWPASMVCMLVVGSLVLQARVWTDWRRWVPILCGITLPIFFLLVALGYRKAGADMFEAYSFVMWALLGLAVRQSPEVEATEPALPYSMSSGL